MNYVICRFYIYAIETTFQTQNLLYTKAISEFLFKSVTQAGLQVYSVYLFILNMTFTLKIIFLTSSQI